MNTRCDLHWLNSYRLTVDRCVDQVNFISYEGILSSLRSRKQYQICSSCLEALEMPVQLESLMCLIHGVIFPYDNMIFESIEPAIIIEFGYNDLMTTQTSLRSNDP